MNKIKLLISIVLSVCFVFPSLSQNLSKSEIQELKSGLNYIQYSTCKIKETNNKAIAEDEYYSVINEVSLKPFSNKDITVLYSEFLNSCKNLKLKDNEKEFIRNLNEEQQKNAYKSAFSNLGSVFVPGRSPQQMIASLIYTSVSNAFAVMNTKSQLKMELSKDLFYLDQSIAEEIFDMQTSLFQASGSLLNKGEEGRITENSMVVFLNALRCDSIKEKITHLESLENSFDIFPPYWFELGNAYQIMKKYDNAKKCYAKFETLKKHDVINKDRNYINVSKNMILMYLGDDAEKVTANAKKHKTEILNYIDIIKKNTLDSNLGEMNSYLARIYYLIGDVNNSKSCINYIINTKTSNAQYISDALNLKMLIMCGENTENGGIYRDVNNYSKIKFGDVFTKSFSENYETFIRVCGDFVAPPFHDVFITTIELINFSFYSSFGKFFNLFGNDCDKKLHFSIPCEMFKNCNVYAVIDKKEYNIEHSNGGKYAPNIEFCTVDYDMSDIKYRQTIEIHFKSSKNNTDNYVTFLVEKVDEDYFEAAEKAYNRIGMDIANQNAQIAIDFGKIMDEYDYEIDDAGEHIKKIRKRYSKRDDLTQIEKEASISNDLSKDLSHDMDNISKYIQRVQENYYKTEKEVLINPVITRICGDYCIVGIREISKSNTGKTVRFNTDYDITW